MDLDAQCKMIVGHNTNNRMMIGLIYTVGFMALDTQCKMVVGTTPTAAWRVNLIWHSYTLLLEGGVPTTALAVGPFKGLGCERSEPPCLVCGGDI